MNLLDMRTVLTSYGITSLICAGVMLALWRQNRRRSPELVFWLADFIMQFVGLGLVALRGILPDFFTMVLSNTLIVGGTLFLLIGLERYLRRVGPHWFNYIYLGIFFFLQVYFRYIQDSLQIRTINGSLGILVMCAQCAWLLLRRVDVKLRSTTQPVGIVFLLFSLVGLTRIFLDLAVPLGNDLFQSGLYDTLVVLTYETLYISLTFTLVLMVSRRLFTDLEYDVSIRNQTEADLKATEEKFSIAFHNSPDAIVFTSLPDGRILDANESFFRMTGFGKEESLGRTTIELNLWRSLKQRQEFVEALQIQQRVLNFEADFRRKSTGFFTGLVSGELIQLQGQVSVLSVIHDITERKQIEEVQKYTSTHDALTGLYNRSFFIVEMQRLERGRDFPVSIIMADVDQLKEMNDGQGHAAGDTLLRRAARILSEAFRAGDVVARIGGDEFAVLLPGTGAAVAEVTMLRLRQMIQVNNAIHPENPVSLSLGVSTAEQPGSLSFVLDEADTRMYSEKRRQENS